MARKRINIRAGFDLAEFSSSAQNLEREFKKTARKMTSIGKDMSMAFTLPFAALSGLALVNFDAQAKSVAQVEAGIKSTGGAAGFTSKELQKMASELQKVSLFGDEDILKNVTAQLLTFTNVTGDAFEGAQQAVLDFSARTGRDLKGASVMIGKALNDPIAGLSALGKAGVQFTDEQKSLIKSLMDTGDAAGAQSIILKELENQYGGSAAAAAAAGTGSLMQLKNMIMDVTESFGKIIMEGITPLVNKGKQLVEFIESLSEKKKKLIVIIGGVLAAIGPVILSIGMAYRGLAIMTTTVNLLTASMNRLFAAIMRNPYTALGAAVAAALVFLVKTQTTLFGVNKEFTKLDGINSHFADTVKENLSNESAGFQVLIMHLKATNAGTKERADLIKKVNDEYGTTISNLTDEKAFLREIDGEYEKIISKMETKIMLEANKERLTALVKERERLMELKKGLEELNDTRKIGDMRAQQAAMQQFQIKYPNFNEDKERLQDISNELLRVQQNIKGVGAGSIALIKASHGGGGGEDTSAAKAIQSKLANIMFAGQTKLKNIRDEFALTFIKDDEIRGRMQLENAQQNELNALDFAISQLEKKKTLSGDEKAELALLNSEKLALMELHLRQMEVLEDEQGANRIAKAQTDGEKQLEIANNLQRKSNLELITNDEEFKAAELEREKNHLKALIKLKEQYGEDVSALQVQLAEKTRETSVSAAMTLGQQTGEALSKGIQDMATIGLAAFSKFMGDVLAGGEMTKEDFGRGLLSSLGDFMVQFGTQMIALGVANTALATAIAMGPAGGLLAISAGLALVTAGAALSALSKKGLETGGNNDTTVSSGGVSVNGFDNEPIVLETRIEGNELILVQSRSNGFRR